MSEEEYGKFGPAVDAELFFTNPVYYEDGIVTVPSKEYSLYVSELMDRSGYSYEMIRERQQFWAARDDQRNRTTDIDSTTVTTGSKGEGTTLFYESDVDHMFIVKNVICADNPQDIIHLDNITLFQTETQEAPHGYTRLRLLRFNVERYCEEIASSLFEAETGSSYLSSQLFVEAVKQVILKNKGTAEPTSGPSTPMSGKCMSIDRVVCFKCVCPNIIKRWMSRIRYHGWPAPETVHEISLLDGHAVPVGSKGSQNMYREWRICYTLAELHLMQNLNESQLKVYILLKKICKSVLNPVCKDLTSYIMKNIVLWMCEVKGLDGFVLDLIMDRLFDCIRYLKKCVEDNNLPSYMIPERNLLVGRLDIEQKQTLTSVLSDLIKERGMMFLKCEKLCDAMIMMYKTPNRLREKGEKRDKVEKLLLELKIKDIETGLSHDTETLHVVISLDRRYTDMEKQMMHLIHFDDEELLRMGKTSKEREDLLQEKLYQLLS